MARYEHLPIYKKAMDLTVNIPETRPCTSYPALYVLPEPGGIGRFPLLQAGKRSLSKWGANSLSSAVVG